MTATKRSLVTAVVTLPLFGIVVCFLIGVHTAHEAEANLHAVICTTDLLSSYTKNNPCTWPSSWDDLRTLKLSGKGTAFYKWPDDFDKVKTRVRFDFESSFCNLLDHQMEFRPVKPIDSCYPYQQYLNWLENEMRNQNCCKK
jgi:hypothetical protein